MKTSAQSQMGMALVPFYVAPRTSHGWTDVWVSWGDTLSLFKRRGDWVSVVAVRRRSKSRVSVVCLSEAELRNSPLSVTCRVKPKFEHQPRMSSPQTHSSPDPTDEDRKKNLAWCVSPSRRKSLASLGTCARSEETKSAAHGNASRKTRLKQNAMQ